MRSGRRGIWKLLKTSNVSKPAVVRNKDTFWFKWWLNFFQLLLLSKNLKLEGSEGSSVYRSSMWGTALVRCTPDIHWSLWAETQVYFVQCARSAWSMLFTVICLFKDCEPLKLHWYDLTQQVPGTRSMCQTYPESTLGWDSSWLPLSPCFFLEAIQVNRLGMSLNTLWQVPDLDGLRAKRECQG